LQRTKRARRIARATLKRLRKPGEDAEWHKWSDAIVTCHLRTMARLEIYYDLLARESENLASAFWDAAFEMLKKSGAIQLATTGKWRLLDYALERRGKEGSGSRGGKEKIAEARGRKFTGQDYC